MIPHIMVGGIAKNHNNSTFDHSTGKDVDPESAAIVAFALSLPFSNKESESSNNNIIDMFLLVKVSIQNHSVVPFFLWICRALVCKRAK